MNKKSEVHEFSRRRFLRRYAAAWVFFLVWLYVAWLAVRPVRTDEPDVWKPITNDLYGFTVEYPQKWRAETYGELGFRGSIDQKLRITGGPITSRFRIAFYYQSQENATLDDVITWGKERLEETQSRARQRGIYDFEIDFQELGELGSRDVMIIQYALDGVIVRAIHLASKNGMMIISLQSEPQAFEQNLEDFNRVVSSLEFLNQPPSQ